MSLDRDIALLGSVELLSDLTSDQLRLLAFSAEHLDLAKGAVIYREGQEADCGYVVASGAVELSRQMGDTKQILRTVEANHILGEMALISQTQRLTTATVKDEGAALQLSRALFRRMLEEYPETAAGLHAKLSLRLSEFLQDVGKLDQRFAANR